MTSLPLEPGSPEVAATPWAPAPGKEVKVEQQDREEVQAAVGFFLSTLERLLARNNALMRAMELQAPGFAQRVVAVVDNDDIKHASKTEVLGILDWYNDEIDQRSEMLAAAARKYRAELEGTDQ